jgi:hypothetical protein
MISIKSILVGFFSGIILSVGWVVFIDGHLTSHDKFPGTHILPPLFATFAAVCINLVSINDVSEKVQVKLWLFFWVTTQCICVGTSVFILSTEYPLDANYPGVSILIQTLLCMVATFLFFVGR